MLILILIDIKYLQKVFLTTKKVQMAKIIPAQVPTTQFNNPPSKISDSPTTKGEIPPTP